MVIARISKLFPVWAILLSATAFFFPTGFAAMKGAIVPLLAVIMFGMGMTLTWENFRKVFNNTKLIGLGVFLQYSIMPLTAFIISKIMRLPVEITVGMVLVGTCPGGTASNVICYLAGGNVALSITMTMISTLLAVMATPLLTWVYTGQIVPVPVLSMLLSILKIIIIPVLLGVAANTLLSRFVELVKAVFPLISILAIVVIIAIVIGLNQSKIATVGLIVVVAVISHNLVGALSGYWIPRLMRYDEQTSRTIAIEVAMQNSGLSVALAVKYFSALAALPGALFSVWHNLSGSFLASYWASRRPD